MSLLERIQSKKQSLRPVDVNIMLENGMEVVERRSSDGSFVRIEEPQTSNGCADESTNAQVSNRQRKKIEYKRRLGFVVDEKPDLQLARITDNIFLGSQDIAAELNLLKAVSITHIINCATGVKNSFPKHFEYLNLEILDLPDSKLEDYSEKVLEFLSRAFEAKGRVFVHCNAGISRAPSIVIMYLIHQGMQFNEAFALVKSRRTGVRPNPGFLHQLQELKKS
ncbi:unnamed protein product, partial [Mesorhabditis belari]|uniref:Dual specificity protein phosphatase 19 n=1 Tax=Mesorhabditis belari TaxID=2138241 RepID=A0AAF3EBE1_9BILA